jgi:hypothetical protein
MNADILTGLLFGTAIGSVLSLPLVIWSDQIFDFLEDVISSVREFILE